MKGAPTQHLPEQRLCHQAWGQVLAINLDGSSFEFCQEARDRAEKINLDTPNVISCIKGGWDVPASIKRTWYSAERFFMAEQCTPWPDHRTISSGRASHLLHRGLWWCVQTLQRYECIQLQGCGSWDTSGCCCLKNRLYDQVRTHSLHPRFTSSKKA